MIQLIKSPTKDLILREADPGGGGWYGAKRGKRKHEGLDIVVVPGEEVFSPITGKFIRVGQVYEQTTKFKLIEIENDIYEATLMYMKPYVFQKGELIKAGDPIGIAQDVASFWGGGMRPHLHLEIKKYGLLTDPEPLLMAELTEVNP